MFNVISSHALDWGGEGDKVLLIPRPNVNKVNMSEEEKNLITPKGFSFNPAYDSRESRKYGSKVFYENKYDSSFYTYIGLPLDSKYKSDKYNYFELVDNHQAPLGVNGWKLMDDSYSRNLKHGYSPPNSIGGAWNPNGHAIVQEGPFEGKSGEFRYIGYTFAGTRVENPYFPPDRVSTVSYWDAKWIEKSWTPAGGNLLQASPYTEEKVGSEAFKVYQNWFREYLFPKYPQFVTVAQANGAAPGYEHIYWSKRLMWQVDPVNSSGVLVGWHNTGGNLRYRAFTIPEDDGGVPGKSARPNIRMSYFSISEVDKETGNKKLIAETKRSITVQNAKPTSNYISKYVVPGKTYELKATYKNMPSSITRDTFTNPTVLDYNAAYDDMIYKRVGWHEQYKDIVSYDRPTTIPSEGEANFTWEYTVPENKIKKEIMIMPMVSGDFSDNGDNYNPEDDSLSLTMKVMPEDLAIQDNIVLYDDKGNETDVPTPFRNHTIKVYVDKVVGVIPVGSETDSKNHYATVNITINDAVSNITEAYEAEAVLLPDGTVEIEAPAAPQSNYLKVCASINAIHTTSGQDTDISNNGPVCKVFRSETNFSVKNFKVSPGAITRPQGASAGSESLTFNFDLFNQNPAKEERSVRVVLSSGSKILKSVDVNIPPDQIYPVSWDISNVALSYGDVPFMVEVNPAPRKYTESKNDGSNPYTDNAAATSIIVNQNSGKIVQCKVVHTKNTWKQDYRINEWRGHEEEYKSCKTKQKCERVPQPDGTTKRECETVRYDCKMLKRCVTDKEWSETVTKSHYEEFKITKVLFKSKLTKDLNGGDGWVDITNGTPGKIKAGYGFELQVYTHYKTNRESNMPPGPWSTRCSGRSVSPGGSRTSSPNIISLKMPYNDTYNKPVFYNLYGNTISSAWDDRELKYTLPVRNAFGIKDVPQIFINETARDGIYNIKIDTDSFYGISDKPGSPPDLCDSKTIKIQVIGGGSDDLKTHIIQ